MKDQVTALLQSGIPAGCLNSAQSFESSRDTFRRVRQGQCKLLYVAPERLKTPEFLRLMEIVPVSLLAVDEAHCISQWGQDFRPSYLQIAEFASSLPVRPPVGAFTATATGQVKEDIRRLLRLQNPLCLTTGFDRPNLFFEVVRPKQKDSYLTAYLRERDGQSGIVYCATRKTVETVCETLRQSGFRAARYHAGLPDEERWKNQEDFLYDRAKIMVATNAFGMGIDKSNVSFVVHYNMPKNIESYYQEAGRAGRDGSPARCTLLFSLGDVRTARFLIDNTSENEALSEEERERLRRRDLVRLDQMAGYCKTSGCLRAYLLRYFGQDAPEHCGNCGSCLSELEERDITVEAQKILSAVARVEKKYRFGLGVTLIIRMLRGSKDQRVLQLGLDQLSTYGILRGENRDQIRAYIDCLLEQNCLRLDGTEYPVLRLGPEAKDVLFQGKKVAYVCRKRSREERREDPKRAPAPANAALFEALRALRARLANEEGVPAYLVFSNAALSDMAARQPRTMDAFLQVSGVGAVKAQRYGKLFLQAIAEWQAKQVPAQTSASGRST